MIRREQITITLSWITLALHRTTLYTWLHQVNIRSSQQDFKNRYITLIVCEAPDLLLPESNNMTGNDTQTGLNID